MAIIDRMSSPHSGGDGREKPARPASLFSIDSSDPDGELVDRTGLNRSDIEQIDAMMAALARLRAAEEELSEASLRYMQLGRTDMRALHFLMVSENTGAVTTPGMIAQALGISSASTTKLLDRLEEAGHIRRAPHPSDRRALAIAIEPATRLSATRTVGAAQARRVLAARRLDPEEREVVIGFLEDMAELISVEGLDWGGAEHAGEARGQS